LRAPVRPAEPCAGLGRCLTPVPPRRSACLCGPDSGPRATVAGMRQAEAADIVALEVLRVARERGEPVTIVLVREVIRELSDHASHCCEACEAARKVPPDLVYLVARAWFSLAAAHHG